MPNTNDLYQDALIRHATRLVGVEGGMRNKVVNILNKTELDLIAQITEQLERIGTGGRIPTATKLRRLEKMLLKVRTLRTEAWKEVNVELKSQLKELSKSEVTFTINSFSQSLQLEGIGLAAPTAAALRAATFDSPFKMNSNSARPLAGWMATLREADLRRIEEAVRIGFVEAENVGDTVRRLRGTRAANFRDGLLQLTRRQAETVVRTAVNHFSNAARETVWQENEDIILGLRWTAVLDGRTTPVCQSRDGKVAPLGNDSIPKGMPLLNPPGARPPAHAQCRSIMVAIVSPEGVVGNRPFVLDTSTGEQRQIVFRQEARTSGKSVSATRTSWAKDRVGIVPAKTTYQEFLQRQSVEFQNEVLGPNRGKLFRSGKMDLDDFVAPSGRKYTLRELRQRDAEAFQKSNS